jgi:hypothetical protein
MQGWTASGRCCWQRAGSLDSCDVGRVGTGEKKSTPGANDFALDSWALGGDATDHFSI